MSVDLLVYNKVHAYCFGATVYPLSGGYVTAAG
ncbi:hypothetical protein FAES_0326 [Fibrella aestuarina BUZ 2]|uniref:Uncharacterized protein n=1 Tax=Fibrella aestuarina BUZ 2 TaxID=1166018 RepID=I0K2I6_9BACT|nr:hypothetical protein FAES_0326 [Fibrella aestuarina BUZ 2]